MANGYTASIYENKPGATNARAYLWQVARGFGFTILQRDDPLDVAIKMPEPSDYHEKALVRAEAELQELRTRSEERWIELYNQAMTESAASRDREASKCEGVHQRYMQVLEEIKLLNVPPELQNLTTQAIKWLEESDLHDGHVSSYYLDNASISFEEWKASQQKSAEWHVEYHKKEHQQELERVAERRRYIQMLIDLVGTPPQGLE